MISLSSCEPELHSIVSSMSDAIFARRCLEFLPETAVLQVRYTDSSSARQLVSRQGCGKIRHLSGKVLWVQGKVHDGEVHMVQVPTAVNAGDIGTKPLPKRRLLGLMWGAGMVYVDSQEPVGEAERAEMAERAKVSKDLSKLTKAILQITMLMGLGATGAAGQEEFCPTTERQATGDSFWMMVFLLAFVFSWLVFIGTAICFWKRLGRRLYWNEVQQPETDTYLGNHRDMLEDVQRHVRRVDNDLRAQVDQYIELNVLEDLITTMHFGFVEVGGFAPHSELIWQQREMLIQERANLVMFDMRQRIPDNTDTPPRPSIGGVPAASSVVPTAVESDHQMEGGEEEAATDDDMENGEGDEIQTDGTQLSSLMTKLRRLINEALAAERFEDASELQCKRPHWPHLQQPAKTPG